MPTGDLHLVLNLTSSVSVEAGTDAPTLYVGGDYGQSTTPAGEAAKEGAVAGVMVTGENMGMNWVGKRGSVAIKISKFQLVLL